MIRRSLYYLVLPFLLCWAFSLVHTHTPIYLRAYLLAHSLGGDSKGDEESERMLFLLR